MPPQGGRGEAGAIIMGPVSVSGQIRLQAKSGAPFAPKINFDTEDCRTERTKKEDRTFWNTRSASNTPCRPLSGDNRCSTAPSIEKTGPADFLSRGAILDTASGKEGGALL
ncbi:hypothetical protein C0Q70_19410 [Pomacea canaliculata]|uniref:Uncharacterized protein n=1 Tax=Pomacea canaliculata TaxID=400727 RepID=A0A2T7NJ99_POMCA|nr:hypothetical protein C0Q70_19410 [Pomacea canaliculata]